MILSFRAWIYVADKSGGFTNHLADLEDVGSHHTDESPAQVNLAAQAATTQIPPKKTQEEENFDLIKRYWTDPESTVQPQVDNSVLLDGIDRVTIKLAECVSLAQSTLDACGTPHVKKSSITKPQSHHSDDIFTHIDRIDNT